MKISTISSILVLAALALPTFNASAVTPAPALSCAPQVKTKLAVAPYLALNTRLSDVVMKELNRLMGLVKDQATYAALVKYADLQVVKGGRLVITTPDGTVVYDSGKNLPAPTKNTFANFVSKTINENHNSRIAILDAQLYECGVGVETKFSTSDRTTEDYVAARLGLGTTTAVTSYLNNLGTVRLSVKH